MKPIARRNILLSAIVLAAASITLRGQSAEQVALDQLKANGDASVYVDFAKREDGSSTLTLMYGLPAESKQEHFTTPNGGVGFHSQTLSNPMRTTLEFQIVTGPEDKILECYWEKTFFSNNPARMSVGPEKKIKLDESLCAKLATAYAPLQRLKRLGHSVHYSIAAKGDAIDCDFSGGFKFIGGVNAKNPDSNDSPPPKNDTPPPKIKFGPNWEVLETRSSHVVVMADHKGLEYPALDPEKVKDEIEAVKAVESLRGAAKVLLAAHPELKSDPAAALTADGKPIQLKNLADGLEKMADGTLAIDNFTCSVKLVDTSTGEAPETIGSKLPWTVALIVKGKTVSVSQFMVKKREQKAGVALPAFANQISKAELTEAEVRAFAKLLCDANPTVAEKHQNNPDLPLKTLLLQIRVAGQSETIDADLADPAVAKRLEKLTEQISELIKRAEETEKAAKP